MNSEEFENSSKGFDDTIEESKDTYEENTSFHEDSNNTHEITDLDLINFIGNKNTQYYFEKFKSNSDKKNFASWNWASFFLGGYWLLYRKLYKWFIGVWLVKFFGALILGSFSSVLATIFDIVIMILLGVYGNCIYVNSSKKKINSLKSFFSKFGDTTEALKDNGGTNILAPLVLLAISCFVAIIIIFVFASVFSSIFMNYPFGF